MGARSVLLVSILSVFFNSEVQGQCQPCNDVIPALPQLERRARNSKSDGVTEPFISDYDLIPRWYCVGHYKMPDSSAMPEINSCGTYYPIYLKGTPNLATLTSAPKMVFTCLRNEHSDCDIEYDILIRNCNGDIQYNLPHTDTYSAFCFDPPFLQNVSINTVSPAPENVKLGTITIEPELKFKKGRAANDVNNSTHYSPYVIFKCIFNSEPLFYTIDWYIDTAYFTQTGPSKQVKDLHLHEKYLTENDVKNVTLPFNIQCGVKVSQDVTGKTTTTKFSNVFFAGLKVNTPHIVLRKGEEAIVKFQPTFPIGCDYTSSKIQLNIDQCKLGLNMVNPDEYYTCDESNVMTIKPHSKCGDDIPTLKFGETWNRSSEHEITITTSDFNYNDRKTFTLHLRTSIRNNKLWDKYNLDQVKVTVVDKVFYKHKVCYSHVDPHMKAADGKYYEFQYEGVFLLYRNTKYQIEVQMKTVLCFPEQTHGRTPEPKCACGVAIRAGADVFMINLCGNVSFIGFLSCEEGGIIHAIEEDLKRYQIYTPTGTLISVMIFDKRSRYEDLLNIDITMSPKDFRNIDGLCGNFNNDANDDIDPDIERFRKKWSLTERNSLFHTVKPKELVRWEHLNNGFFCVCKEALPESKTYERVANVSCSASQYLDCTFIKDVTEKKCSLVKSRRRRSVDHFQREIDTLLNLMSKPRFKHSRKRQKRQATEYLLTKADAEGNCTKMISESLVVQNYSANLVGEDPNAVIQQCVIDLLAGNSVTLGLVHVESMNDKVKREFKLDPQYVTNNIKSVETFIVNTCPGDCNNRGTCSDEGECVCISGYHGPDCSIFEEDVIDVDYIEGGNFCDFSEGEECRCFYVYTTQLIDGFICQFSKREVDIDNNVTSSSATTVVGERYDLFSGFCCQSDKSSTNLTFVTYYDIALSNSGSNFGSAFTVVLFESSCQSAIINDDKTTGFQLKYGHCFIDGQCIANGERHVSETCYGCNSFSNAFNWTFMCVPTSEDPKDDNLVAMVIGIVGGVLLLGLLLGTPYVIWRKNCRGKNNYSLHERPITPGERSIDTASLDFDNGRYYNLEELTKAGEQFGYETLRWSTKGLDGNNVDQHTSEYETIDLPTKQNHPGDKTGISTQ